jgi:long-chain acyl-CoA synthetase
VQEFSAPIVVAADPDANIPGLLAARAAKTPDLTLFALPDGDGWRDMTAAEFERAVIGLAKGLVAAGIQPGDRIGLLSETRFEWTLFDFAVMYAGALVVPIYETSSPEQIKWIVTDSGATAILVESPEHFLRVDEIRAELADVHTVWQIGLGDLDKLTAGGTDVPDSVIDERRRLAKPDDLATIIYTAGTTGRPKGCELTHANFVELSRNAAIAIPEVVHEGASTLLFVTIAHVFARFIAVLAIHGGVRVGHQPDTRKLMASMGSFHPTFLLAVPRVFEKVYNSAEQKAEAGGRGNIFRWAADVAVEHSKATDAGRVPIALRAKFVVADRLVLSKLRAALGGNVEWAVSGSAPLGLRLGHFFRSLGVTILEGYGLTETSAPATVNRPSKFKIGSVGPALPGVDIRIADDGEIQIRGIDVFAGYHNNPDATAEVFDDGWFRTGDIGALDDEGYLRITGRKKEIIVTAGGKNVSPAELEDPIRANPIVSQVVVVGEARPFVAALVTLDEEMLPEWLAHHGADRSVSVADAAKLPVVRDEIQKAIDHANTRVSRAESIREFVILPEDFTQASGHLTPKMSIKRAAILKDFADDVDRLYSEASAHHKAASAA